MSELLSKIQSRRSIRQFKPDSIPQDILDQIITAGTWSATGRNLQSPIILAVTNREMRDRLSSLNAAVMGATNDPFYGAPVVLVVLANKACPTYIYDGSMVIGNMMLAAHELGLGSCWIHRAKEVFDSLEGKDILRNLGIEGEYEGIGNCILGYPDGDYPAPRNRKDNWVYYID